MEENTIRAGRIEGSPLTGLCERVVIQADRVYDGCVSRYPSRTFVLTLEDITDDLTYPYTYTSTVKDGDVTFDDVTTTVIDAGRIRVEGDVKIPVKVSFTDSLGASGTGTGTISVHRDLYLAVPPVSVMPYEIEVAASIGSEIGTFLSDTTVSIVCCMVILTRVIVKTDIVLPTYGACVYPDCLGQDADACSALLNLPLFPPLD